MYRLIVFILFGSSHTGGICLVNQVMKIEKNEIGK